MPEKKRTIDAHAAQQLVKAATSRTPASLGPRRTANTHEFYRYPARFNPDFTRAAVTAFTSPGDVVLDPFVGGGTTLVESRLAGRVGIGNDLNRLATFVARVKSTAYSNSTLDAVEEWAENLPQRTDLQGSVTLDGDWIDRGYFRNMEGAELWRLRKMLVLTLREVASLPTLSAQAFVRCAILRTAQWGLDMRGWLPSVPDFREALFGNLHGMADAARNYSRAVRRMERVVRTSYPRRTVIVTGSAQELPGNTRLKPYGSPRLILTSPPYPGVYVNYHRWKLHSRWETPLPFWIVNQPDGHGLAYYTMSARAQKTNNLARYFAHLRDAFCAIASLCHQDTTVVQVVGFSDPDEQLPRYLDVMRGAGLHEILFQRCATEDDGRLWRTVPGRRWWALRNAEATAKEVVLFHRPRRQ